MLGCTQCPCQCIPTHPAMLSIPCHTRVLGWCAVSDLVYPLPVFISSNIPCFFMFHPVILFYILPYPCFCVYVLFAILFIPCHCLSLQIYPVFSCFTLLYCSIPAIPLLFLIRFLAIPYHTLSHLPEYPVFPTLLFSSYSLLLPCLLIYKLVKPCLSPASVNHPYHF